MAKNSVLPFLQLAAIAMIVIPGPWNIPGWILMAGLTAYSIVSGMNIPKPAKRKTPPESFHFMGATAEASEGMPKGLLFGRNMVGGQILSLHRDFPKANKERLFMLIGLGQEVCQGLPGHGTSAEQDRIYINDQPLSTYIEAKPNPVVYYNWSGGRLSTNKAYIAGLVAPRVTTNYTQNTKLSDDGDTFIYRVKNRYAHGVKIGIVFMEGLYTADIEGFDAGSYEDTFVTVQFHYRDVDANPDTWIVGEPPSRQLEGNMVHEKSEAIVQGSFVGQLDTYKVRPSRPFAKDYIITKIGMDAESITTPPSFKIYTLPIGVDPMYGMSDWKNTGYKVAFNTPGKLWPLTHPIKVGADGRAIILKVIETGDYEPFVVNDNSQMGSEFKVGDKYVTFLYEGYVEHNIEEVEFKGYHPTGSIKYSQEIYFPESTSPKNYEIRVKQVKSTVDESGEIEYDDITIPFVEEFEMDKLEYPDTCLLGIEFSPTEKLSGGTPKIKVDWDGQYVYTLEEYAPPFTKKKYFESDGWRMPRLASVYRDGRETIYQLRSCIIQGDYAYASALNNGKGYLTAFDISDPKHIKFLGSWTDSNPIDWISVKGRYVYCSNQSEGGTLRVVDVIDPTNMQYVSTLNEAGGHSDIQGDYLYLGNYQRSSEDGGLKVIDISNPVAPVLVGSVSHPTLTNNYYLQADGNYVYLTHYGGWNGFIIYDVSSKEAPVMHRYYGDAPLSGLTGTEDTTNFGAAAQGFRVETNPNDNKKYMCITSKNKLNASPSCVISFLDVTDPSSIIFKGSYDMGTYTGDNKGDLFAYVIPDFANNLLYAENFWQSQLHVIDITTLPTSSLETPTHKGILKHDKHAEGLHDIRMKGNYIFGVCYGVANGTVNGSMISIDVNEKKAYGRNPANILYTIYRDVMGKTEAQLDVDSFRECMGRAFAEGIYFDYPIVSEIGFDNFIDEFKTCTGFYPIPSEGKIKLVYDEAMFYGDYNITTNNLAELPDHTFDETNIVEDSLVSTYHTHRNLPNVAEVTFRDAENMYEKVVFLVQREDVLAYEKYTTMEILLTGVTSRAQAHRRGNILLNTKRLEDVTVEFKTTAYAFDCEVRELISISFSDFGWSNKLFRINKITRSINENDPITIEATNYTPDIYLHNAPALVSPDKLTFRPPNAPPLEVTDLTAFVNKTRPLGNLYININFQRPDDANFEYAKLYLNDDPDSEELGTYLGNSTGTASFIDIMRANWYKVSAVSVSKTNIEGATTATYEFSVDTSIFYPPDDVDNFISNLTGDALTFNWTEVDNMDMDYYEIRQGEEWGSALLTGTRIRSTTFTTNDLPDEGYSTYLIKAFDIYGDESTNATSVRIYISDTERSIVVYDRTERANSWIFHEGVLATGNTASSLKLDTSTSSNIDDMYNNMMIEVEGLGRSWIKNYNGATQTATLEDLITLEYAPADGTPYKIYGVDNRMIVTPDNTLTLASRRRAEDWRIYNRGRVNA